MPEKYSLDDILNEFSGGGEKRSSPPSSDTFDLDALLGEMPSAKKEKAPLQKPSAPAQKPVVEVIEPAPKMKNPPAESPAPPRKEAVSPKAEKKDSPAPERIVPPKKIVSHEDKKASSDQGTPLIQNINEQTVRINTDVREKSKQEQPLRAEPARRFRHGQQDSEHTIPLIQAPAEKKGAASRQADAPDEKAEKNTPPRQPEPDSGEEKEKALRERRKKKISQFIIDSEEEKHSSEEKHTEYRSFEDAAKISAELSELRATVIIRMLVLVIFALISAYTTAAKDYNLPLMSFLDPETQQNSYAFVQMTLCLLSGLICYSTIVAGLKKLFTFKADYDSLCAAVTVSALIGSLMLSNRGYTLRGGTAHIYANIAIASLLFNNIGKLLIVNRVRRNFRYITDDSERYAIVNVENEERAAQLTKGTLTDIPVLSTLRKTGFAENFLKYSYSSDICDRFCRYAVPGALAVSLITAVLSVVLHSAQFGGDMPGVAFSVFTLSLSICSCLAMPLVVNLPLADASKSSVKASGATLGYQSIDEFSDTNAVMLDATKLFPPGSVRMTTLRPVTDTKINDAIIEAASLTAHANSILKHFFYNMIDGRTEVMNCVESYIYEDSMGLSSWINNRRVLLGNRELMLNHSIEGVPSMTAEKEACGKRGNAVYISVSGNVMAMFVLELTPSPEIKRWLHRLCRNDICLILRCVDSLVTVSNLSEIFDIPEEMIKIIPFRMHDQFAEETTYASKQSAGMICSGKLSSMASLIIGAKRLRKTAAAGLILQSSAMLLGVILCLIMTISGNFTRFNASMALIYNLIWTIVTLFIVSAKTRS